MGKKTLLQVENIEKKNSIKWYFRLAGSATTGFRILEKKAYSLDLWWPLHLCQSDLCTTFLVRTYQFCKTTISFRTSQNQYFRWKLRIRNPPHSSQYLLLRSALRISGSNKLRLLLGLFICFLEASLIFRHWQSPENCFLPRYVNEHAQTIGSQLTHTLAYAHSAEWRMFVWLMF